MTTHRDLTTPDLRPCPFCGSADLGVFGDRPNEALLGGFSVCCRNPGCQSTCRYSGDRNKAIAAWNRRPRTFTAAEVAEAFAGLEAKWRARAKGDEVSHWHSAAAAREACADELHERITHWLRENEG